MMARFKIDYVVKVEPAALGAARLETSLARVGEDDLVVLPALGRPGEVVSQGFLRELKRAMGIPVVEPKPLAVSPAVPADDDTVGDGPLEEEEDPSIRFREPDKEDEAAPADEKSEGSKLVRSPWLWVSIGAVAAIVAGFAVTAHLAD